MSAVQRHTTNAYIRLAEAPGLNHPGNPSCNACEVETEIDDREWMCPSCGTTWPTESMDASSEDATLYPDWAGEELTGPVCPNDDAWRFTHFPPDERDARIREHTKENPS